MQLLVSVRSVPEAMAALAGGADIIDAKNPAEGPLGAVSRDGFRDITAAVARVRPVSAALGDAADESTLARSAHAFASAGARFVKVGFAGVSDVDRVAALIAAGVRAVHDASPDRSVVAVAYADADRADSISHDRIVDVAARAGARGVLLDTFDKQGSGLREIVSRRDLARWVAGAHGAGLFVALAGKLTASDLPFVGDVGADIVGVRGAACDGGRTDAVSADRVRLLRSAVLSTCIWIGSLAAGACTATNQSPAPSPAGRFDADVTFLRQHTDVILLADPSSGAQAVVAPAYQGRVMTSTIGGASAPSFGWLGRDAIRSGRRQPHIARATLNVALGELRVAFRARQ